MYSKVQFLYLRYYSDEKLTIFLPLLYFREVLQQGIKAIVFSHLCVVKSVSHDCCA